MKHIRWALVSVLVCGAVLLGVARPAWADRVELKDGTRIEGEVLEATRARVRIRIVLASGASGELSLARADVAAIHFDAEEGGPEDGEADAEGAEGATSDPLAGPLPTASGATRTRPAAGDSTSAPLPSGRRTIFLLDHSGSMAIGARWEQAVLQTERMIGRLPLGTPFDVMLFSAQVRSLTTKDNTSFRSQGSAARIARLLREDAPSLQSGTHFLRALRRALERRPAKIVLISDGVGTLGGPLAGTDALRLAERARAERVPLDVLVAHDGEFALDPSVEDKGAAKVFLQRLARAGGGVFFELPAISPPAPEALPDAFRPGPATPDGTRREPRFTVFDVLEREAVARGFPSRFRIHVDDPVLARLAPPDVWEYGGAATIEVQTRSGNHVLRLRWEEGRLETQREIQVTGKSLPGGIARPERLQVGGVLRIVYRRGRRSWTIRRVEARPSCPEGPRWIEVSAPE